jgi:ribonuclease J
MIADFNFKDTDRLKTFYAIAKERSKKLVISTKDAVMLKHLSQDPKLGLPSLSDSHIAVFKQKAASGTYADEDYATWEKKIFAVPGINLLTASQVKAKENDCIFVGGFFSINDMIDIKPSENSTYIFSHSEPFNEEMEIDFNRLQNWIRLLKLDFKKSHCSGHANWTDIKDMVKRIDAKMVIPIHTTKPELFKDASDKVRLIEYAKPIVLT